MVKYVHSRLLRCVLAGWLGLYVIFTLCSNLLDFTWWEMLIAPQTLKAKQSQFQSVAKFVKWTWLDWRVIWVGSSSSWAFFLSLWASESFPDWIPGVWIRYGFDFRCESCRYSIWHKCCIYWTDIKHGTKCEPYL